MTRYLYGAGGDGEVVRTSGLPYANAAASVYNSRSGGSPITDLQTLTGAAISSVTSDPYGQVAFYGPDNYIGTLWLDFGGGVRWALSPKAVDLAATQAIAVQRTADASALSYTTKSTLPYNTADPLEQALAAKLDPLVIPRFPTQTARDAAFPAPTNGDRCYRTDLASDQLYNGTSWVTLVQAGAWNTANLTITPTSGTMSVNSGSLTIRYQIQGKAVIFSIALSIAADTTFGTGTWTITGLPFNISSNAFLVTPFPGQAVAGSNRLLVVGQAETATTISLWSYTSLTSTALSRFGASPTPGGGAWAASNFVRLGGTAELA
jgi:hypothetical protein